MRIPRETVIAPCAGLRPDPSAPIRWKVVAAAVVCATLSACGGGGGGGGVQTVTSTPPPSPPPAPPPPPPVTNFDTAEFRRSDGPEFHGADAAWRAGATGQGSIIAIIDSGIDSDSPEFTGRLHPDSGDVAGNRGVDPEDDHGTNVALVAAGGRDDTGVLGIAFDAQVLALRADMPGSCGTDTPSDPTLGCVFADSAIAAGVRQAIESGAAVINLSLGGGNAAPGLEAAIRAAADAGIVIVVAAGNGGDGSEPGVDPNQPDAFATSLLAAGGGNVIIVGSVDDNGDYSDFSNRAGSSAASYITARGERICCVYDNGELFVEQVDGSNFVTLYSGTSFAAPQVSGAIALLAQAFPNLTGAQMVEILLETARDAGDVGIDAVFGTGILDIAAAFQPVGTTSLAGTGTSLALADGFAIGSAAMGDAFMNAAIGTVVTDRYNRAFDLDLGARSRGAVQVQRLRNAVGPGGLTRAASTGALSLAVTVDESGRRSGHTWAGALQLTGEEAEGARVLAARVAARIAPEMQVGVAIAQGAGGLVAQMQGAQRGAFMIAPDAGNDTGVISQSDIAFAARREFGAVGVSVSAQRGSAWVGDTGRASASIAGLRESASTTTLTIAADHQWGGLHVSGGLSWLGEEATLLGAQFNPVFGPVGADTVFLDANVSRQLGEDWRLGGAFRAGVTRPRAGGLASESANITTNGWSFDLTRFGALAPRDSLGLRISQPLRVSGGALLLDLPTAFDYATETAIISRQTLNLAPAGREVMGELAWTAPLSIGTISTSVFYRSEPGHVRAAPDDIGMVLRYGTRF